MHCKYFYKDAEIEKHVRTCGERKVKCFVCKNEYPIKIIGKHHAECKKRKSTSTPKEPIPRVQAKKPPAKRGDKRKRDDKKNDPPEDDGDQGEEKKTRKRKGTQFKVQRHRAEKYKVLKKLQIHNPEKGEYEIVPWIKQFIFGNEWGAGLRPKPHMHGVVITHQKMNFEEFKALFKEQTGIRWDDVEFCKNVKHEIKYVCKEDYRPVIFNIDHDLLPLPALAYICAVKYDKLDFKTYPLTRVRGFEVRYFRDLHKEFRQDRHDDESRMISLLTTLRPWQQKLLRVVQNFKSDRKIIWVVDPIGDQGKSHFSFYLKDLYGALRQIGTPATKDFAYSYDLEKLVVFDLDRDCKDTVNYRVLEHLKDGVLWSPKYESQTKTFRHLKVQVLVLANFEPEYQRLSLDRWHVLILENGQLRFQRCPLLPLQPIVNNVLPDLDE